MTILVLFTSNLKTRISLKNKNKIDFYHIKVFNLKFTIKCDQIIYIYISKINFSTLSHCNINQSNKCILLCF